MILEITSSIILVLLIIVYILMNKLRKEMKRATRWKADYFAAKSTLDQTIAQVQKNDRY